jgi:hypothetical protein
VSVTLAPPAAVSTAARLAEMIAEVPADQTNGKQEQHQDEALAEEEVL